MSRVTMRDIADRANVSVETVSRALNGKPDIGVETRQTVVKIARELDYVHRRRSQGRVEADSRAIGMVVADNSNPFFCQVLKGAEDVLSSNGYNLILTNSGEQYDKEKRVLEMLERRRLDGILITPTQFAREDIQRLQEKSIPFVLVGRHFLGLEANSVVTNEQEGAFGAVQHLLRLGHEHILFINAPSYISSATERLAGLERAFQEAGLEHKADLTRTCQPTMDSAYNAMHGVLVEGSRFTAVFAFSDLMMLGVLTALREAGKSIPEDVSLVGFDDISFVSILTPPLTTVRQHKYELGTEGARMLLRALRGAPGPQEIVLPTELIVRRSTARAPG